MRRRIRSTVLAVCVALLAAAPLALVPEARAADQRTPADLAADAAATAAGECDDLDQRLCLLPFPNDQFTALDATTPTGRRIDLSPLETPRNVAGKPMDPTEWNRNDGFSPGSMLLSFVPGLDLTTTFGLDPEPETGVGTSGDPFVVRDELPDAVIEAPELSMAPDAPIVLLDADTGARHPYWAELDENAFTIDEGHDRTLIIRPLTNFAEGHRYIVALRDLRDGDGAELAAPPTFTPLRDAFEPPVGEPAAPPPGCDNKGKGKGPKKCDDAPAPPPPPFPSPADIDPADRDARYDDIFTRLHATGVAVDDLYLAWDFHVASGQNLAGRALAIRDDAFAQLGDTDLADLTVQGASPAMTVTESVDENGTRTVHGTVTVPNYLTTPQDAVPTDALGAAEDVYDQLPSELTDNDPFVGDVVDLADEVPVVTPQSRFVYESPAPGPMDTPVQNPLVPTLEAEFTCKFRTDVAGGVKPTLYGHGLLGGRGEVEGGSTGDLRNGGHAMCGVDWIGMATEDIVNVGLILHDISFFPSLADRAQQGFLNFLYVGRALIHPDGAAAHPAFQVDGRSLLDTRELFYDGNSQGGIMGGSLTALAPDFTKSVLGVPGINYSTLLNRSVDWEGDFIDTEEPGIPAYASFNYNAYPDKVNQQLVFALLQMLWDRAEGNGYAQHMTSDPYPNTPPHQVLLEVAFADYQVTNHAAEVEARTIGADFLSSALAPGRHWERAVASGASAAPFGLRPFVVDEATGERRAASGSAIVYWDSGNPTPPNGNVPPVDLHQDPHGDPRNDDTALLQKLRFFATGDIVDVNGGQPNWTFRCPRHPDQDPGC